MGADTVGRVTHTDLRDIPHYGSMLSVQYSGGKKEEEGMFGMMVFVLPSHYVMRPCWLEMAEHLSMGCSELIPFFALLAWIVFALSIKLP